MVANQSESGAKRVICVTSKFYSWYFHPQRKLVSSKSYSHPQRKLVSSKSYSGHFHPKKKDLCFLEILLGYIYPQRKIFVKDSTTRHNPRTAVLLLTRLPVL
jgi:hypothetical protein